MDSVLSKNIMIKQNPSSKENAITGRGRREPEGLRHQAGGPS